jgi:hypothetical protein
MSSTGEDPQIGPLDVDAASLGGAGESLDSLLAALGAELDAASASDAPADGWRVLRRAESGAVTIGAPAEASATTWRIAHIEADPNGARATTTSVHPEVFPVRRSRAERAEGLALRWPTLSRSNAANDVFVIDVVNAGETQWQPDGDPFHVVGVFARPGSDITGFSFGFFGSQALAPVPLDPGDYARVRISITESQWRDLEPGAHELHAMLVTLPVRTEAPLTVDVTQEQIDRHKAQHRERMSVGTAESLRRQLQHLQSIIDGSQHVEEIARIVADAETDDEITAAVRRLFPDDDAAASVVDTPISQFSKQAVQRLQQQVVHLEQRLAELPAP